MSGYCSLKYGLPSVHRTVDGLQIMVCSSSPTRYLIMSAVKVAYVCKFRHPFFSNSLFSLDIAKFSQLLSQVVLDNLVDWTALITSNNIPVPVLLQQIQSLTQLASPLTLKTIFNSSAKDYKLAWVGSDDAICHVGTGLHKVPLARLQEIFLTVGRDVNSGKSKTVRLMEVISILGPFPNVRNTLQGEVVNQKTQESAKKEDPLRKDSIRIMYDSMMDGLGKEIGAGTDDNLRYVDLDVVFADARALVCVVPSDGDGDTNSDGVFSEDGKNVLLFLKEDDLNYRLEELRAA